MSKKLVRQQHFLQYWSDVFTSGTSLQQIFSSSCQHFLQLFTSEISKMLSNTSSLFKIIFLTFLAMKLSARIERGDQLQSKRLLISLQLNGTDATEMAFNGHFSLSLPAICSINPPPYDIPNPYSAAGDELFESFSISVWMNKIA